MYLNFLDNHSIAYTCNTTCLTHIQIWGENTTKGFCMHSAVTFIFMLIANYFKESIKLFLEWFPWQTCFIYRQLEYLCFSCDCNWVCVRMYNGIFFNWLKQLGKKQIFWQWYWLLWVALLKTVSQKQSKLLAMVSDERT